MLQDFQLRNPRTPVQELCTGLEQKAPDELHNLYNLQAMWRGNSGHTILRCAFPPSTVSRFLVFCKIHFLVKLGQEMIIDECVAMNHNHVKNALGHLSILCELWFQGLIAGHLASRVAAQTPLASRARSAFLSSLKAGSNGRTFVRRVPNPCMLKSLFWKAMRGRDRERERELVCSCINEIVWLDHWIMSVGKAYRSFPRELRSCFPFQQLHLGHLATSFGLREAPREVVKKERRLGTTKPDTH